jgi:gliding motility-associated-like protein
MSNKLLLYPVRILLVISIIPSSLFGQSANWYWGAQGTPSEKSNGVGMSVATDKWGNVYHTGAYASSISFGSFNLSGNSPDQIAYLVKFNSAGVVKWAVTSIPDEAAGESVGQSVKVDDSGYVYVAGYFMDTVRFGNLPPLYSKGTGGALYGQAGDAFLVKYDTNGNPIWARQTNASGNGNSYACAYGVACDKVGGIYLAGDFVDSVGFNGTWLVSNSTGSASGELGGSMGGDAFVSKYDYNGNFQWVSRSITVTDGLSNATALNVSADSNGDAYITGFFTDTVIFGTSRFYTNGGQSTNSLGDMFIVKYDPNGNFLWANHDSSVSPRSFSEGYSVAVDTTGAAYITGDFMDSVVFGATTLMANKVDTDDIFVAKYTKNGVFEWAKSATPLDKNSWAGYGITTNELNNVFISGGCVYQAHNANTKIAFGKDTLQTTLASFALGSDIPSLVFKLDTAGNVLCGTIMPDGGWANAVTSSPNGKYVYVGGSGEAFPSPNSQPIIMGANTLTGSMGGSYPYVGRWLTCCSIPVSVSPIDTTICQGQLVVLRASKGDSSYTWAPSTGLNQTTADTVVAQPAATSKYSVIAIDSAQCAGVATATVTISPRPNITIFPAHDSICLGDSIRLNAGGATTYVWSPTTNLSCNTCSNPYADPIITTPYKVVGKNSFGCADSASINLIVKAKPVPIITSVPANDSICKGDSAKLTASGGVTYLWTPVNSTNTSIWVKPNRDSTYTLKASNGACVIDTSIAIGVKIIAITITPNDTICKGIGTTLTATGGGTYLWSNNSTTSSISVNPSSPTTYKAIVHNFGCADSASTSVWVDVPSLTVCCNDTLKNVGDTIRLHATGATAYSWSPPSGLSCSNCPDPIASPSVATVYTVTSTDAHGCSLSDTVEIELGCQDFTVPNVFSPNGDGINDQLVINTKRLTSYTIIIYDRWGVPVFSSNDPNQFWNGKVNQSGGLVPVGVYYYDIKATCSSQAYNKKGFITVVGEK